MQSSATSIKNIKARAKVKAHAVPESKLLSVINLTSFIILLLLLFGFIAAKKTGIPLDKLQQIFFPFIAIALWKLPKKGKIFLPRLLLPLAFLLWAICTALAQKF